jgi:uncharacterized protein with beta-barrel porin domain
MYRAFVRRGATAMLLCGTMLAGAATAAPITALGSGNTLVTVDSATPGTVLSTRAITGVAAGTSLLGIDARPATNNRQLYSVSNAGQLYSINTLTGAATAIGTPIAQLNGAATAGIDFNPTVDRIRIITPAGANLRVNPNDGVAIVDGTLNGATAIGANEVAYTNSVAGATSTTLYVINPVTNTLSIQTPPNAGTQVQVGTLGAATAGATGATGFDIQTVGSANTALATLTTGGTTTLYSVDLTTGVATAIGSFGAAGQSYTGLAFTPNALAGASASANLVNVGGSLDGFVGVPTAGGVALLGALDALPSDADRASALQQLSPAQSSILPDVILQTNEFVDSTLRRYLRDMRAGGTGNDDPTADEGSDRAIGGFLIGTGRDGRLKERGDRNDVSYGATGVIAGVDVRLASKSMIGITGGYDRANYRLNEFSPNSSAKTWFVGGYGTVGVGPLYVDLAGTYGESDLFTKRNLQFAGFAAGNVGATDARYWSLSGTTGLSFDFSGFEAEIYGGARYVDVKVDGYSESDPVAGLTLGDQDIESLQSIAGLRLGADYKVLGASVRPTVRGEWRREWKNDDPRVVLASFNDAAFSTPIAYRTTQLGRDYAVVGAGMTISGNNSPISVVLDYTGQFFGGYDVSAIQGGLRISF